MDADNKPIPAALVIPRGFTEGDRGELGPMEKMASVQVTDREGKFQIVTARPVDSLELEVRAKGLVPQLLNGVLVRGKETQVLNLQRGVSIAGRVMHQGKPLPGVAIGLVWTARLSGTYWGPWEAITDDDGCFSMAHVTAGKHVYMYGKMRSLKDVGAIAPIELTTGADESVLRIDDITVGAGHKVSGHILLSDGRPLPPGSRLNLAAHELWDHQEMPLPPDGSFEIKGVPPWVCGIQVTVPSSQGNSRSAYHLSALKSQPGSNERLDITRPR